jgi:hypothetical protein
LICGIGILSVEVISLDEFDDRVVTGEEIVPLLGVITLLLFGVLLGVILGVLFGVILGVILGVLLGVILGVLLGVITPLLLGVILGVIPLLGVTPTFELFDGEDDMVVCIVKLFPVVVATVVSSKPSLF